MRLPVSASRTVILTVTVLPPCGVNVKALEKVYPYCYINTDIILKNRTKKVKAAVRTLAEAEAHRVVGVADTPAGVAEVRRPAGAAGTSAAVGPAVVVGA